MADESAEQALWTWTVSELVGVAVLFLLLAFSVFGDGPFFSSVSRRLRIAALTFLAIELLIPLWSTLISGGVRNSQR